MEVVLLFLGSTALAIKVATLFRHKPDAELRRTLARMEATAAAKLHLGGPFKVVGRIRPLRAPLLAPASQRPCVGYRLQVDELVMGLFWKPLVRLTEVAPFIVEDETAGVEIDPRPHPAVVLMEDAAGPAAPSGPERVAALQAFLRRRGLPCPAQPLRFSEGILHEDQLVAAAGVTRTELDPQGQSPGPRRLPEKLVLTGTLDSPLLLSDTRECV
jgi:hypothetical protein